MSMIESAYEVAPSADYFIASENLLFAELPYDDYLSRDRFITTQTPRDLAVRIVDNYNRATASSLYPFTIAALDLRQLRDTVANNLTDRINTLAERLLAELPDPTTANTDSPLVQALKLTYNAAQKFDYDSSQMIDPHEGYVDLVDFARKLSVTDNVTDSVRSAAIAVVEAAIQGSTPVVIGQRTVRGTYNGQLWRFEGANGLSIYLPLGERDYRPTRTDASKPDNAPLPERQLTYYVEPTQLAFTRDVPAWARLLVRLEETVPIIRTGPSGLPLSPLAEATSEVTIDQRPFYTPYQLSPSGVNTSDYKLYLPITLCSPIPGYSGPPCTSPSTQ